MTNPLSSSTIAIRVSEPSMRGGTVQVCPIIDGRDIVAEAFDAGPGHEPERLLRPGGLLRVTDEPREVELAEAECTVGCCGALNVTIRRDGDVVIWDRWRDANGPDPDLPPFYFDATEYEAEVTRAEQDHSWEWPARTVARLLAEMLRADPERLARWQCQLHDTESWSWAKEQIIILFWHPGRPALDRPWLQFRTVCKATDEDPRVQASRLFDHFAESDPRERADVVGGSAENARILGYPWPPVR